MVIYEVIYVVIYVVIYAKALYLEVNEKELYKGCALLPELDAYLLTNGFQRVLTNMTCHGWETLYI